ncbi:MAG: type IV secretory system conjugative DNA transfer family protein [Legionella sp.]|nr:type IV secretory system conjugative DNA transfer family protein [Legionella sp.]
MKEQRIQSHQPLRPDEIMKMSSQIALIMRSGYPPIKAGQYIWYKEVAMKSLVRQHVFEPTQVVKQMPFIHSLTTDLLSY